MIDKNENIKNKLALLPDTPGVYQYFDKTGKIIYVGKAKNLKRRVSSYFNKVHDSPKTNILVKNIYDLQYIVVKTEEDALHLENSLIKAYKPRYNVLLKDDKTYPWICLRNEHFPRVFLTRKVYKDGSKYYGPYANVHLAKTVLGLIRELYPIRTCNYALTPENIEKNRFRVCLQYHIKNCKGCCVGKISEQEYNGYIEQVRQILNGDIHQLSNHLLEEMSSLSAELRFEEAQVVKEGESNVACADLQRNHQVHQTDNKRHRYEEDHDNAVGGKDLIVVVRRQETCFPGRGQHLLATHHNGVSKATQQHNDCYDNVHDTETFVVNRSQPLVPKVGPLTEVSDGCQKRQSPNDNCSHRNHNNGFMVGHCIQCKFSEHRFLPRPLSERFPRGSCPCLPFLRALRARPPVGSYPCSYRET